MQNYLGRIKHLFAGTAMVNEPAPAIALSYEQKIAREGQKWGEETKNERAERWINWLQHPLIVNHYMQRALVNGRPWEQWIKEVFGGPAERSLELGCGPAHGSQRLFHAGASKFLEGIDVSAEAVADGERTFASMGAQGKLMVGDVNKIQLQENSYDLIFACHSFHHFVDLEYLMDQIYSALTPRGLFLLEEYVGPTQFQWTDQQLQLVNALLPLLPERLRSVPWGGVKITEPRPSPKDVAAVSPFESIRSAEIYGLFKERFQVVEARSLGGTIQHLLYSNIIHNFSAEDDEAVRYLQAIIEVEDGLIEAGLLPADFMLLIGKRKD